MGVFRNRQRENRWCYEFQFAGKRYRGVCKTADGDHVRLKSEAIEVEVAVRRRVKLAAGRKSGGTPILDEDTLAMAVNQRILKVSNSATPGHIASLRRVASEMLGFFGPDRPIVEINSADVTAYTTFLLQQNRRVWLGGPRPATEVDADNPKRWKVLDRPRSRAEVNHCLDLLRASLRQVHRTMDPLTGRSRLPFLVDVPALAEPLRDPTPMSEDEYRARAAKAPRWVREAAALAWWFGLRRAEIVRLELRHLDYENRCLRLPGLENKSRRDQAVFGSAKGWILVRWLARQARRRGQVRLITWPGRDWVKLMNAGKPVPADVWRPLASFRRAWMETIARAEIDSPRRFHDLRAAYITNIARVASATNTKGLARHSSMVTTERYIKVVEDELAHVTELAASERDRQKRPKPRLVR